MPFALSVAAVRRALTCCIIGEPSPIRLKTEASPNLPHRKLPALKLLVMRQQAPIRPIGDEPNLDHAHRVVGDVEFLMLDVIPGEHALKLARVDDPLAAGRVLVIEVALQHPRIDFEGAVRMPREAVVRRDARHVRGDHPAEALQRTPAADGEMRMQPVDRVDSWKFVGREVLKITSGDEARRNLRLHQLDSLHNQFSRSARFKRTLVHFIIVRIVVGGNAGINPAPQ